MWIFDGAKDPLQLPFSTVGTQVWRHVRQPETAGKSMDFFRSSAVDNKTRHVTQSFFRENILPENDKNIM